MCGIFGALFLESSHASSTSIETTIANLFRLSETRGREAAGLAVFDGRRVQVLKQAQLATQFVKMPACEKMLASALKNYGEHGQGAFAALGHSRLVTNGFQTTNENNQPVIAPGVVGIHNGIIVNEAELWAKYPRLQREHEVDTELLMKVLRMHFEDMKDIVPAARKTFADIYKGSASVAVYLQDFPHLLLATNTGSLFYAINRDKNFLVFASERFILQELLRTPEVAALAVGCTITQIQAGDGMAISLEDLTLRRFDLDLPFGSKSAEAAASIPMQSSFHFDVVDNKRSIDDIKRCTKCILPVTYPCIDFDAAGVCNFCRQHKTISVKGEGKLRELVEKYRSKDGSPDVIVAFSGGRDSAYGLHYIKNVLGMNPVAFTYDWGLVTDLARRNQARMCSQLGVEHVIRAADIPTKRRYVRKNVEAWLKKPELGMVTLFTAGDKEFYHHARQLRKETGIKLVIFCTGNMIEDTTYKTGFCGFLEKDHGMTLTGLAIFDKVKLLWYYFKQYATNPAYWNESLWDTAKAYYHTFIEKDDFLYLFHYLTWTEEKVVGTIINQYDWEVATDTKTTWRIGDGTAPFYNYIYTTIAGFSEDDVMLANMVREGMLTRDEAIEKGKDLRKPRYPSIREYANLIGFNCEEALNTINSAPKLYEDPARGDCFEKPRATLKAPLGEKMVPRVSAASNSSATSHRESR